LTKHVSADQALLAALGALSTIRHKSMPMIHTLLILSGIGPHSLNNADPIGPTGAHDVKPQPSNTAQRRLSSRPR
jgi:hypothetical protein